MATQEQPTLDVGEFLEELELKVDRLRALYDQYFMGIEKIEPLVQRKDVDRRIYQMRREQIRNTALRFKFNMIVQRFTTFATYWQRVARQIEEGTYRRDLMRARAAFEEKREAERTADRAGQAALAKSQSPAATRTPSAEPAPPSETGEPSAAPGAAQSPTVRAPAIELDLDIDDVFDNLTLDEDSAPPARPAPAAAFAAAPARPAAPASVLFAPKPPPASPPARPSGAATPPPRGAQALAPPLGSRSAASPQGAPRAPARALEAGLSDERVKQLYATYVAAKKKCNEPVEKLEVGALKKKLEAMVPKVKEKHGCKDVDFRVVIRQGKAVLVPVPK